MARSAGEFDLLGYCGDDSPGEALDKSARIMQLDLHPDVGGLSGGAAVEKLAQRGDPSMVELFRKSHHIMEKR